MSGDGEIERGKSISYTQFSMWKECPFRWRLNYIDGNRVKIESINTIFGRSMHEVLQEYLTVMYKKTIPDADALDLPKMLFERMSANFKEAQSNGSKVSITREEMLEFYEDGLNILDWFVRNKSEYFAKRGFELVGVEVPIEWPIQNGITMFGYLDVVIRDTVLNRIKIYDFKTSHQGWNKYQKADKKKQTQLVLYKSFYAMQYKYDLKNVDVEFLVLKRKLFENVDFPQKRVQKISPASGTITTNSVLLELKTFINSCFDKDGNYLDNAEYEKRPDTKTCKYCEFKDRPDLCDKNNPKRAAKLIVEMNAARELHKRANEIHKTNPKLADHVIVDGDIK